MSAIPAVSPARSSPRLPWLDGLRGVAALAVVSHHFYVVLLHGFAADSALRTTWLVTAFMKFARWGTLGVPVFFVLSGYFVGQAWLGAPSWQDFAQRRLRRIFPAYYASLALLVACAVAAKIASGTNDVTTFPAPTPGHLLALASLFTAPASHIPAMTWVYWSLTYEVAFYAVLALARALPARARLGALLAANAIGCTLAYFPSLAPRPGPLFFCDLWPLFGLGLALALVPRSRAAAWGTGLVALLGAIPVAKNSLYPGFISVALPAAVLIGLVAHGVRLPRWAALEHLGNFSYSLYLTHVPVLLLVDRWLILPASGPGALVVGITVTLGLQLSVAWAFHRAFEKPFLRARRQSSLTLAPA